MKHNQYFGIVSSLLLLLSVIACDKSPDSKEKWYGGNKGSVTRKLITVTDNFAASAKEGPSQAMFSHHTAAIAPHGKGVVYIDKYPTEARIIHNDTVGKMYKMVGDIDISPDGSKAAYLATEDDRFKKIVVAGVEGPPLLETGDPKFTPDGKHFLYIVTEKDIKSNRHLSHLAVDHKINYSLDITNDFIVSPDSRWIALITNPSVSGQSDLVVTDIGLKDRITFSGCGDSYSTNKDKTLIAAACNEGDKKLVKVIDFKKRSVISTSKSYAAERIMRITFAADNRTLAFTYFDAKDNSKRYIVYNNKEEQIPVGDEIMTDPIVLANNEGVLAGTGNFYSSRIYRAFGGTQKEGKRYSYISNLVGSLDLKHYAHLAGNPAVNGGAQLIVDGKEGPYFDIIVAPFFTRDGRYVVCRARNNGKRFVVVVDLNGKIVSKFKEYDMVFEPTESDDGKSLEYAALDGKELWWIVEKIR